MVGSIRSFVNLGLMTMALTFLVLGCDVPTILGMPFLATINPTIDWVNHRISIVTIKGDEDLSVVSSKDSPSCSLVSAK